MTQVSCTFWRAIDEKVSNQRVVLFWAMHTTYDILWQDYEYGT